MSAGYDLSACLVDGAGKYRGSFDSAEFVLDPGQRVVVPTGLAFTVPNGTYGRIGPRSGLAHRYGIDTLAGIIDQDYSGEVGIILVNLGSQAFRILHGARIAQLVIERIALPQVVEVERLQATLRGSGGFGSTGL